MFRTKATKAVANLEAGKSKRYDGPRTRDKTHQSGGAGLGGLRESSGVILQRAVMKERHAPEGDRGLAKPMDGCKNERCKSVLLPMFSGSTATEDEGGGKSRQEGGKKPCIATWPEREGGATKWWGLSRGAYWRVPDRRGTAAERLVSRCHTIKCNGGGDGVTEGGA